MSRHFDKAAEFCQLAGTPDLLEYLQLPPDVLPEDAQAALKKKRKYMQGMQSNPKYRKQALFLIKHFAALSAALEDPAAYQRDALRRAESVHLPILEMTVKGVLAGGTLTEEQEAYLLRNATELGVSEATFSELMDRLCQEAGVRRPANRKTPRTATPATAPPIRQPGDDFYTLLGLVKGASLNTIRTAYEQKMAEARALPSSPETEALIVRLDLAWSVLSDPRARQTYHITSTRTGPPARARDEVPGALTAPPVRRTSAPPSSPVYTPPPGAGSRLEVLGEPTRRVAVGSTPTTVELRIRNGGSDPMGGSLHSDQAWVRIAPDRIDPDRTEQVFEITFDPASMPSRDAVAVVRIATDRGETAAVRFLVSRSRTALYVGAGSLLMLVVAGAAAMAFLRQSPKDLVLEIDPWADEVRFDGEEVGRGRRILVPQVPAGSHRIEVVQPGFKSASRPITDEEFAAGRVHIELEQLEPLRFEPTDRMRRTSVPQDEASRVFAERARGIDACIERVVPPGSVLTGAIRVHIDRAGRATGIEVQGKPADDPQVARCLERQAAALVFSPLEKGDYATVRYEYSVTAPDPR